MVGELRPLPTQDHRILKRIRLEDDQRPCVPVFSLPSLSPLCSVEHLPL